MTISRPTRSAFWIAACLALASFAHTQDVPDSIKQALKRADEGIAKRARCAIDPCHFYWTGRESDIKPFAGNGGRASELMGAMLNVQLRN